RIASTRSGATRSRLTRASIAHLDVGWWDATRERVDTLGAAGAPASEGAPVSAVLAPPETCVTTIRTLAMDAVQKANSGHPGGPMGLAAVGWSLFTGPLRYSPTNPQWPNRDRFVLSNGHSSMLLYSLLFLTGYDVTLDDLKSFRQLHSRTPGHPEYGV